MRRQLTLSSGLAQRKSRLSLHTDMKHSLIAYPDANSFTVPRSTLQFNSALHRRNTMQDSLATLANGMPDATMKSHLEPATLHSKTVDAPKDAQPVTVTPVD